MALSVIWTRHLPKKDKESFEKTVRGSVTALSRLKTILEEEYEAILKEEQSPSDFSDASWSHKQAFRNGEKSRLKKIKDLLILT